MLPYYRTMSDESISYRCAQSCGLITYHDSRLVELLDLRLGRSAVNGMLESDVSLFA